MREVIRPFNARMREPLKPSIREIYTDRDTVIVFFDARGVALDGAHFSIDDDSNEEIYGPGITARRIFEGGVTNVPSEVVEFRDKLEEYTTR